ncbi:phosphoenolpyruvate hydrolase family protein [Phytohabitans sp. ZYX-F-186]|uniref:Phosphoenolpyruvate hydrolase family protein n=1 Tax=Phytohabitans maris TaxID=3071409 RepID=A0ABU0ZC50_9ACTN|nr:phosphoenolpyruvate hydrolase family protein [Phytohabitans sp. ZYX-F-186]MDQ7904636.1 phosphoenolpyruvate hydrolase family protein [Phytohabitans sp. ZYX-F-186]
MEQLRPFTRSQIIDRLRATIAAGEPVVAAGCSSGLIARSAVAGGADLVVVYNTGRTRLMGLRTTHLLNHANPTTVAMFPEIQNVVDTVPIIGGAEPQDPAFMRLSRLVDLFQSTGFDGIINFPTVGPYSAPDRELVRLGHRRDEEMVEHARAGDYFTMCYAYTAEQARGQASAGADVIVPHAGWTTGGQSGAGQAASSLAACCELVQTILESARRENPDVIVLAHGGSISSPADTRVLYEQTDAQGFVGASSVERVPIENAILASVSSLRNMTVKSRTFSPDVMTEVKA